MSTYDGDGDGDGRVRGRVRGMVYSLDNRESKE